VCVRRLKRAGHTRKSYIHTPHTPSPVCPSPPSLPLPPNFFSKIVPGVGISGRNLLFLDLSWSQCGERVECIKVAFGLRKNLAGGIVGLLRRRHCPFSLSGAQVERFRNRFDSTTPHHTPLEEEHAYNRHSINRDGERVSSFRTELCISHSGQGRSNSQKPEPRNISREPAHHSLSPQTHKKYNFKNSQAEIKGLSV